MVLFHGCLFLLEIRNTGFPAKPVLYIHVLSASSLLRQKKEESRGIVLNPGRSTQASSGKEAAAGCRRPRHHCRFNPEGPFRKFNEQKEVRGREERDDASREK